MSDKLVNTEKKQLEQEQNIICKILRLLAKEHFITMEEELRAEEILQKGEYGC